jgi:hypothetical protein
MGGDELKVVHEAFGSNYITRLGAIQPVLGAGGVRHRAQDIRKMRVKAR